MSPTSLLMGRVFLLLAGIGMIFFSWLYTKIAPDSNEVFWDRAAISLVCFALLALSYIPRMNLAKWQGITDVFFFFYAIYSLYISYNQGFPVAYLFSTLIVVQLIFLAMRTLWQINLYLLCVMGTQATLLFISSDLSVEWRFYLFAGFAVICLVNFYSCYTRIHDLELIQEKEREGARNQSTLRAVLESSKDMIWSLDRELTLISGNEAFRQHFHRTNGDNPQTGLNIRNYYQKKGTQSRWETQYQQALAGEVTAFQDKFISGSEYIWLDMLFNPIREGSNVVGISVFARDITEQKSAQKLLKSILDSSASGIMALRAVRNPEGKIINFTWTLVNKSAERIVKMDSDTLLGSNLLDLMPGNEADGLFDKYVQVTETGEPIEFEHCYNHENISDLWLHIVAVKLYDGFAVTFTDIRERKKVETEQRQSQELLQNVIDATPDWIFVKDKTHKYQLVNQAFARSMNRQPHEFVGKNDIEMGFPEDLVKGNPEKGIPGFWADDQEVILSGEIKRIPEEPSIYEGRQVIVSTVKVPLKDKNHAVWGILGFVHDITVLKETERELKKLSLVASKTNSGVAITNARGELEWVNEGFSQVTGYSFDEVIGKRPGSLLQGPETDPDTVARIREKLAQREPFTEEILNYSKNGNPYWISMNITPILNEQGEVEKFIAIENDISVQKEAEWRLKEAKIAAENAANAKSEFLATMSHEIRTPMNAVIGMTGLLLETELTEEQREYVEMVRTSGDNLLTVINDILDFSKIESGKLELEKQPFNLVDCVEEVLDLLSTKASERKLELLYDILPGTPIQIVSDPTRLSQVLVNLINNALKFTEKGEVEVQISQACSNHGQTLLKFGVRDTGIGISEDKLHRLFKSFSQVDASTTRKYGGTGLGLAICQRLVSLMGGEIWVESTYGQGSTFFFTIEVETSKESVNLADISDLEGLRVLLVDDNQANLTILREQVRRWGMESVSSLQPLEAIQLLKSGSRKFDLAIIDMQMPEIDGYELARRIRALPGHAHLPIVVLTSMGENLTEEGRSLFSAYVSKPVRRNQLLRYILRVIGKGEQKQPKRLAIQEDKYELLKNRDLKILLAEDNAVNQKVAVRILEKMGLTADAVSNGLEALTSIRMKAYDLVFMDMQMPEMDGLEATRHIRQLDIQQPVIIAMTANAMKGDREKCIEAGMNDYISKPIKLEDVHAAIRRWFEQEEVKESV